MFHLLFRLFSRSREVYAEKRLGILLVLFSIWMYSTTGFMYFELPNNPDLNWTDASWWAIVTMTTVGYGDLSPTTVWGQILVGYPTMLLGVAILGYLLSMVASAILESKMKEIKGMKKVSFSGHIIICGFKSIDNTLDMVDEIRKDKPTQHSDIVLIDDKLEEIPTELAEKSVVFIKGNPSREKILDRANFREAQCIFILADLNDLENTDQKNLAVVLTAERLCPDIFSIVECANPENEIFFNHANCDSVVCVQSLSTQMLVQELQDPGVHDVIEELTSNRHGMQFYLADVPATIDDYNALKDYFTSNNGLMIGIQRGTQNIFIPSADFSLQTGDRAILIAHERL